MGLISRVSSRTYRNKKTWTSTMKTVNCNYDVDLSSFGDAVKMTVKGQVVTVSGPRGTLKRDFSHLKVELKKTGAQSLRITKWWATMKQKAALRTVSSHINNMATGVTAGFRYKMRTVYAHFPINMIVKEDGDRVEIRNFLGEKINREVQMLPGVKVSVPQNKRTNSGSKVTTSKTSAEVALWSTTKPSSETRISESSSMVSTFPRKPTLSRITNFSDSKLIPKFFVSVKS